LELESLAMLPIWYAAFLLSLTCHEAAHALAAYYGGDPTAYHGGQVTLNPLPHIQREILGTVVIPLITFVSAGWMMGWASAPYDPHWADRHPKRAAWMAAAGPGANLLLALIAFAVLKLGLMMGTWLPPEFCCGADQLVTATTGSGTLTDAIGRFFSILLSLNLVLMLFNLTPVSPFDGGAMVAGWIEPLREPLRRLQSTAMGSLAGLLVAIIIFRQLPIIAWIRDLILYPGQYGG
jgi:Zn-dependent protease